MKSFKNFLDVLNESSSFLTKDEEIKQWLEKRVKSAGVKISNGKVQVSKIVFNELETSKIEVEFSKCIGEFVISHNMLSNLNGCPSECDIFDARDNNLISLEGGPAKTKGDYLISSNEQLQSLEHGPIYVGGNFHAAYSDLKSDKTIQHLPETIVGSCMLHHNSLTNLKGIHKRIKRIGGQITIGGNPITSHILGLLLIPGLFRVSAIRRNGEDGKIDEDLIRAVSYINKYLKAGKTDKTSLLACQEEMMDDDLDDYAEL